MSTRHDFSFSLKKPLSKNALLWQDSFVCRQPYSDSVGLMDLHQHRFIEISFVMQGVGVHRIWNETLPCRRGDLCIVNLSVPHGYFKTAKTPLHICRLLFDVHALFDGDVADSGSESFLFGLFSANNFAVHTTLKNRQIDTFLQLYDNIAAEISHKNAQWQQASGMLLALLLIQLQRMILENEPAGALKFSEQQTLVAQALQLVHTRYTDPQLSLGSVAKQLCVSKSSASRMFHVVTGDYFSDYLRSVRLKKAAELMTQTAYSNQVIAYQCGCRDLPTFYKQFRQMFGQSPGEYRESVRNEKLYYLTHLGGNTMSILNEISEKLQKGKAKDVSALVTQALDENIPANDILAEGLISGMNIIGEKFRTNEVFVPDVLVAARAMNAGLKILKPALSSAGIEPIGKAVICTVKGDMHDIGKNLVKMMIEGQGIECIDLGVDVDPQTIVDAVKENGAQLVCLSALLTTTMDGQKDVIEALVAAGIRDQVKVMVGGAPITQEYADAIGADCYTLDAASASVEAKRLILEMTQA